MTSSFDDMTKMGREFFESGMQSCSAVARGAQAISGEATSYAQKALETGGSTVGKLLAVDSLDKVVGIQTDYARSAYEGFVAEAGRMAELYADLARDAFKPFESIVARPG